MFIHPCSICLKLTIFGQFLTIFGHFGSKSCLLAKPKSDQWFKCIQKWARIFIFCSFQNQIQIRRENPLMVCFETCSRFTENNHNFFSLLSTFVSLSELGGQRCPKLFGVKNRVLIGWPWVENERSRKSCPHVIKMNLVDQSFETFHFRRCFQNV